MIQFLNGTSTIIFNLCGHLLIMKKILLAAVLISICCLPVFSQQYIIPGKTKRILFLGNSITYAGQYVSYIEAYIKLTSKNDRVEFMNLGLPSETVSGLSEPNHADGKFPRPDLHERLQRVLSKTKPDLVFACYGMNDGIYLPFDSSRLKKFQDGIRWLHDTLTASGIPIIFFTPPVYDDRKGKDYALVLDKYSQWLLSTRDKEKWRVIDIHFAMKKFLADQRLIDSQFKYAEDGVHPNSTGHWIMARTVLSALGYGKSANADSPATAFKNFKNGEKVLELIEKRQGIMKDAWLSFTGHSRPMMPAGLPIRDAKTQYDEQGRKLEILLAQ